jgi:hypothetical protein
VLASLLNVYEKTNANLLKTYLKDIDAIKAGTFTDEGGIEKPEAKQPSSKEEHTNIAVKPTITT